MPADDKLDILRDMLLLIGDAVLSTEQRARLGELSTRYDQAKATGPKRTRASAAPAMPLPDVHEEYRRLSPDDFTRWASSLSIPVLKQLVKAHQFDPAGLSARWRKPEKFAELMLDQLAARGGRGEGFGRIISGSS